MWVKKNKSLMMPRGMRLCEDGGARGNKSAVECLSSICSVLDWIRCECDDG